MSAPPPDTARALDAIIRAAQHLRAHHTDLTSIGWEPTTNHPDTGQVDTDRRGKTDWTPRAGDPRARRLLDHLDTITTKARADLVGAAAILDRILEATRPIYIEAPRGSIVSRPDLDEARKAQGRRRQRGDFSPVPLIDQPDHPSKGRR